MKKQLVLFLLLSVSITLFAQQEINSFYSKSLTNNNAGMYVLGGWALTNIATGAVGWSKTTGPSLYFHQMNVFWNTINLGIAGLALYSNYSTDITDLTPGQLFERHLKTENLFLINAGLDIAYMGTGLLLRQLSGRSVNRTDMLRGYGNSVMLQGGFLFLFDGIMWGIQRHHRLGFLDEMEVSLFPGGLTLTMTL